MNFGLTIFKKDEKVAREPCNVPKRILITQSEKDWLEKQAEEECVTELAIVRRALKLYRQTMDG